MFSGRVELIPDPFDGTYFIDRSPLHFAYILEYLRNDKIKGFSKMDKNVKALLADEAIFYEIAGLVELIGLSLLVIGRW